jgi:branched-chain amino acid aminotransferase
MNPTTQPNLGRLSFAFQPTDYMWVAETDPAGHWGGGALQPFGELRLSPASAVLNHAQAVFEGMKAQRTPAGELVLFRPADNARRFRRSAARLAMPPLAARHFIDAVEAVVRANAGWVPPSGEGSLYLRPVMMGSGPILGVTPAEHYTFYVFACPVGPYLPGEGRVLVLPDAHRAMAHGTGDVKAAGNYAPTFVPHQIARDRGFKDVLYLDARHNRYVEELGSSNFFAFLRDGTLVTPELGTVLPGITRDSVLVIARDVFGWRTSERRLDLDTLLAEADEAFFTGTAAVVQPITLIHHAGRDHVLGDGQPGQRTEQLRSALVALQTGRRPDPFGWVHRV